MQNGLPKTYPEGKIFISFSISLPSLALLSHTSPLRSAPRFLRLTQVRVQGLEEDECPGRTCWFLWWKYTYAFTFM